MWALAVCVSPVAAVTNYYLLNGLNDTNVSSYCSGGERPKMGFMRLKLRHWQSCVSPGGSGGEFVPFLSRSEATCLPWPLAASLSPASTLAATFPSLALWLLLSSFPSDHTGPTWEIQDNSPISRLIM